MESRIQNSESRMQNPEPGRPAAKSFQDLIVWQKAHAWVLSVYRGSDVFPAREIYGLTNQLRRAAASVPANIAEGFKKRGGKDKLRFFNIAQGSLEESRYFLILAHDLGYGDTKPILDQLGEVSRLLDSYYRTVSTSGF
jgi:four helix bundle protein